MNLLEQYHGTIQYVSILVAFLCPMVLAAKLYYILKVKEYSPKGLLTSATYLILIIAAYLLLNEAQRFYLIVYLGLMTFIVGVFVIAIRLAKRISSR